MNAEQLAVALNARRNGRGWLARCPAHDDNDPSLAIDIGEGGKPLIKCRAGCEQAAVIDALRKIGMWSEPKASPPPRSAPRSAALNHPQLGEPTTTFEYHDATGRLIGIVCRWDRDGDKTIRPVVPDRTGWRWQAFPEPRPLYRLPDLAAHPDKPVLIVEGEKAADAAREIIDGYIVSTWPGGCEAIAKADLSPLNGRDVVLWPDADDPGRKAMRAIADRLAAARSVRGIKLPDGLPKGWDLADAIPPGLDPMKLIEHAPNVIADRLAGLKLVSASDLMAREFKPIKFAVPEIIAEGLNIMAGKPKTGKSWLGLGCCVAVAGGGMALGNIKCIAGDVLYLALEDTERRLHGRLLAVLQGSAAPKGLTITTQWRRADEGGIDDLRAWLTMHPNARLVLIDTLAKVRGRPDRDKGVYENDYAVVSAFKALADEFTVPIVLVHHLNKEGNSDPLMAVSGTAGLTGSADTIIVLRREANDPHGLLYVRGRDVNEAEIALQFDNSTGQWLKLGAGQDWRKSEERRAVIRALADAGPMTPREIADAIGKKAGAVRMMLSRMVKSNEITQLMDGRYGAPN